MPETAPEPQHAIVEVLGHAKYEARIEQTTFCGEPMLTCHVLAEPPFDQLLSAKAIFRLTPCSEAQARASNRWGASRPPELEAAKVLPARATPESECGACGYPPADCICARTADRGRETYDSFAARHYIVKDGCAYFKVGDVAIFLGHPDVDAPLFLTALTEYTKQVLAEAVDDEDEDEEEEDEDDTDPEIDARAFAEEHVTISGSCEPGLNVYFDDGDGQTFPVAVDMGQVEANVARTEFLDVLTGYTEAILMISDETSQASGLAEAGALKRAILDAIGIHDAMAHAERHGAVASVPTERDSEILDIMMSILREAVGQSGGRALAAMAPATEIESPTIIGAEAMARARKEAGLPEGVGVRPATDEEQIASRAAALMGAGLVVITTEGDLVVGNRRGTKIKEGTFHSEAAEQDVLDDEDMPF